MATFLFANNASTLLAAPISSGDTTLTVTPGAGTLFPSPVAGQMFSITLFKLANTLIEEIVYVTARSTDTFAIVRAQEGTTALSWNAGDAVVCQLTAGQMGSLIQASIGINLYAEDTSSTPNVITASVTTPQIPGYAKGQVINIKPNTTNTGPTVANIGGFGNIPVLLPNQTALSSGNIVSGLDFNAIWIFTGGSFKLQMLSWPLNAIAGKTFNRAILTATQNFTVPAGVTQLDVQVQAPGGGSEANGTGNGASGCGAAGAYARALIAGLTPGAVILATIGAPGTAGLTGSTPGGTGGTTSFGPYLTCNGGQGGGAAAFRAGSLGGTAMATVTGALLVVGGDGSGGAFGADNTGSSLVEGLGGASFFGGGGRQGVGAPEPGRAYGSGAGGVSNAIINGAIGGPAIIIVEWFA